MTVVDTDQISKPALEGACAAALSRSQSLGAHRIQQADASRHNFDHSVAFKLGEGTTDSLNGQAEKIRNVLTTHRQRNRLRRTRELNQPIAPADQKTCNFFLCGTASEQDHLVLRLA